MSQDVKDVRFLVVGLGRSGQAAVSLLCARGAQVRAYDDHSREELGAVVGQLQALGATFATGGLTASMLEGVKEVVLSPGVPPEPVRALARDAGVHVTGELELASRFVRGKIVAIAGTNGKSTVTRMLGDMLERGSQPVFVGGNLGVPLSEVVGTDAAGPDAVLAVEVSSFQLETVEHFHAHIAVLLNVTDDHLDRYEDFAAYAAAKGRVFAAQSPEDFALVPAENAFVTALAATGDGCVEHFDGDAGIVRVHAGELVARDGSFSLPITELGVAGHHNVLNACAAASAARLLGLPGADIEAALRAFTGLPHRMQGVATRAGVYFVDDSKATNVGAAAAALEGFASAAGKVVLIAGGRDKGGSYEPLLDPLVRVARAVICIGEAAPKLERALGPSNVRIERAATMEEAVRLSARLAHEGDTVLLAPACSSYDMFRTYAHRGAAFAGAARALSNSNAEESG